MPRFEYGNETINTGSVPNRQGIPSFLGSRPVQNATDLRGGDVAIIGIPFVSPIIGYENDLAPRNVRITALHYVGTYLPELGLDPMEHLTVLDYGDVDLPFGDIPGAMAAVERAVDEVLDAGCLPITLGGNAPASSYAVLKALAEPRRGGPIGIISLDGHTDTMADYGDAPNSSNWVRSAYLQLDGIEPARHVQVGIRGMNNRKQDLAFFHERGMRVIMAPEALDLGSRALAREVVDHATSGVERLWLAVDLDVLDAFALPEWDWPDPLGLAPRDVLLVAYEAGRSGKLAGLSIMMVGGLIHSALRLATWTVLYALAGVAARANDGNGMSSR